MYGFNTFEAHYKCTTDYMKAVDYKNVIVIHYRPDMDTQMTTLFQVLNIPKTAQVNKQNVSLKENIDIHEPAIREFVQTHYASDYKLIDLMMHSPSTFKYVI